jgi:hypothetical protein
MGRCGVLYLSGRQGPEFGLDISARIKIGWSKGQTLDESKYKYVVFAGLFLAPLTTPDSLPVLLILAVMDGVLEGVQTWDDLPKFRLPATSAWLKLDNARG